MTIYDILFFWIITGLVAVFLGLLNMIALPEHIRDELSFNRLWLKALLVIAATGPISLCIILCVLVVTFLLKVSTPPEP